jgi:hypothetical protein
VAAAGTRVLPTCDTLTLADSLCLASERGENPDWRTNAPEDDGYLRALAEGERLP